MSIVVAEVHSSVQMFVPSKKVKWFDDNKNVIGELSYLSRKSLKLRQSLCLGYVTDGHATACYDRLVNTEQIFSKNFPKLFTSGMSVLRQIAHWNKIVELRIRSVRLHRFPIKNCRFVHLLDDFVETRYRYAQGWIIAKRWKQNPEYTKGYTQQTSSF